MTWDEKVAIFVKAGNRYDRSGYSCIAVKEFFANYEKELVRLKNLNDGCEFQEFLIKKKEFGYIAKEGCGFRFTKLSWEAKVFTFTEIFVKFGKELGIENRVWIVLGLCNQKLIHELKTGKVIGMR